MGYNSDIVSLEGNLDSKISTLVKWIDEKVKRVVWTNEQFDTLFGKRSAEKILEDGHTCYMNPCLDMTLVGYEALKQNGILPTLVAEE